MRYYGRKPRHQKAACLPGNKLAFQYKRLHDFSSMRGASRAKQDAKLCQTLQELSDNYNMALARIENLEHQISELSTGSVNSKPLAILRLLAFISSGVLAWVKLKPGSRPRRVLRSILLKVNGKLGKYPKIKKLLIKILSRYPRVYRRLQLVIGNSASFITHNNDRHSMSLGDLTPSAHRVYKKLDFFIHEYQGSK